MRLEQIRSQTWARIGRRTLVKHSPGSETPYELCGICLTEAELAAIASLLEHEYAVPTRELDAQ